MPIMCLYNLVKLKEVMKILIMFNYNRRSGEKMKYMGAYENGEEKESCF